MPFLTSATALLKQRYPRRYNRGLVFYCDDCFLDGTMQDIIPDLHFKYSPNPVIIQPLPQSYYPRPPHSVDWTKYKAKPSLTILASSNNYTNYFYDSIPRNEF